MENAADALKIAFAVFVFVVAIAIAFTVLGKAKKTSDVVLYHSDKTNFYDDPLVSEDENGNRKVGYSEIVSTLYKSTEESVTVSIVRKSDKKDIALSLRNDTNGITEEEVNEWIEDNKGYLSTHTFTEEFIEVAENGSILKSGTDGSQIVVTGGHKRVYITYREI